MLSQLIWPKDVGEMELSDICVILLNPYRLSNQVMEYVCESNQVTETLNALLHNRSFRSYPHLIDEMMIGTLVLEPLL